MTKRTVLDDFIAQDKLEAKRTAERERLAG
jgi:hypothetical protein